MSEDTHALLQRLIGQFASPYDFLRELVQNAMDAGSDLVEVELHEHPGDHASEVIFELVIVDAGSGMDEEIIDGELTRLFGTSKTGDRTMVGGFGIGFVSVFAWEPERVLVQTGRQGGAWEVVFFEDHRFETRAVDLPFEGTTVRLFRRGAPSQRAGIAEAIEDALRRWCRFAPVEITFEDVRGGEGPTWVSEAFEPTGLVVSTTWTQGPTRAVLGFGSDPQAALLRRGLVLEEGDCSELLPTLAESDASSMRHLVARIDSPRLRTGLARQGAVKDEELEALQDELRPVLSGLRERLVERVQASAARGQWDAPSAATYSHLHAHLMLEYEAVAGLSKRPLLRLATGTTSSIDALVRQARLGVVGVVGSGALELRLVALRSGVPVLEGRWDLDAGWLAPLLQRFGLDVQPLRDVVSRVEAVQESQGLAELVVSLLPTSARPAAVRWGELPDADPGVLGGVAVGPGGVVTQRPWTPALVAERELWLRPSHPVVAQALRTAVQRPDVAALGLATAIAARGTIETDAILDAWEAFS